MLDSLSYPESTMASPWLGPEKNFQNEDSQFAINLFFRMSIANTVNSSFNYTLFQLLYKHYVALKSTEIT